MPDFNVRRRVLIPAEDGSAVMQVNTCYRARTGPALLQTYSILVGSDTFGNFFQRASEDNGRTWSAPAPTFLPETTPQGVLRQGEQSLFLDEEKGVVLQFYNLALYPQGHFTGDATKHTRIFMAAAPPPVRFARPGEVAPPASARLTHEHQPASRSTKVAPAGGVFSAPRQVIQKGYDETRWMEGVEFRKNSAQISFCAPVKLKSGRILLPIQLCPLGSDFSKPFLINEEAGCFIGEWRGDALEWERSEMVKVDPALSSRGLCEPAIAELTDGSLLMVCRGSNSTIAHMPGRKWRSVSRDGGRTWSAPAPLTYENGEDFFSPATGSRLIRHSRTGRLYWIGNITPANPDGNRPRYPLQIAEVDEAGRCLRKQTVRVIEDRRPQDPPLVQFSNFRVYEDRETGEFVLILARIQERQRDERKTDLTSPAYEYRIECE